MEAFQIIVIILLSLVVIALGIGLVILYKSVVRRDAAAKSLQSAIEGLAPRVLEIEAAMKGHLPALERSTGESVKQLIEVAGLLRGLDQIQSKLLTLGETQTDIARESKVTVQTLGESIKGMINTMTDKVASATQSAGESTKGKLDTLAEKLNAIHTLTGQQASATRTIGDSTDEKLSALIEELKELRKQLDEVTRF